MALYAKNCAICMRSFETDRIGTVYCSKKCRNKSRSIPTHLLESLIAKAARGLQIVDTMTPSVREFIKRNSDQMAVVNSKTKNSQDIVAHLRTIGVNTTDSMSIAADIEKLLEQKKKEILEQKFNSDEEIQLPTIETTTVPVVIGGIREDMPADPEMLNFNLEDNRNASLKNIKDSLTPIGDYDISENAKYINTEEFPVSKNGNKIKRLGE